MIVTMRKFIGIQNSNNQMWFHARCGYKPQALLKRRWHPYTNIKPSTWRYASPDGDATDFKDIEVAKKVCDNLNRDLKTDAWEVVSFERKTIVKIKRLYKPNGCWLEESLKKRQERKNTR